MIPRLIALDLDGTLLPSSKRLTARTRAAVAAAAARGIHVVVATGKAWHLAARYADELRVAGPVVSHDGAYVKDWPNGFVRHAAGVPAIRLPEILDRTAHLELAPFVCDAEDRLFAHPALSRWEGGFLDVYATDIEITDSPCAAAAGDPFFLGMLGSPSAVEAGAAALRPMIDDGLFLFSAEWFERDVGLLVVRPKIDKGTALAQVAADLGVAREEVVAVGDWKNDRSMIEWAGAGVVMANAHPELLAVADVVLPADSEAEGAAAFLEDLVAELFSGIGG